MVINGCQYLLKETIRFFGIILKISIQDLNLGGYDAYWSRDFQVNAGRNYRVKLCGIKPWARDVMQKHRFKQIRAALRPEMGRTEIGDKCHQLRWVINKFNTHARMTFIPGWALSFDEGGNSCRSRFCAVRQYNKDKPNKYRVDFLYCRMQRLILFVIWTYTKGRMGPM